MIGCGRVRIEKSVVLSGLRHAYLSPELNGEAENQPQLAPIININSTHAQHVEQHLAQDRDGLCAPETTT
jgi:hypothetical protein